MQIFLDLRIKPCLCDCVTRSRGSVCNVLLTSCEDGVCRLWSETLLPEDSLLGGQISENTHSFSSSLPGLGGNKDKIQHALEVLFTEKIAITRCVSPDEGCDSKPLSFLSSHQSIHHLKHLRRGRRRSSALVAHSELLPSQLGTQDSHTHRHIAHHANALCHFHISASINPNTGTWHRPACIFLTYKRWIFCLEMNE